MTAIAIAPAPRKNVVVATFEESRDRILPLLPKGETLERVIATVQLAIANDPTGKLAACTPTSLFTATCRILQWGMDVGTTAHLVPYGTTATAVPDYKGLAELIVASGCARAVQAFCVYDGEHFLYVQGTDARIEHTPARELRGRAKMLGAYCIIRLPFQQCIFDYFPLGEIDAVRKAKSHQWKNGECPPWWAKKYAIKQVAKTLPKSPRIKIVQDVLTADDEAEIVVEAPVVTERVRVPAAFDEDAMPAAVVTLPQWRAHPLAGRPLTEIESNELEGLYSSLMENAPEKYADLIGHIAAELESRRAA